MFTGIIQQIGEIKAVTAGQSGLRLAITHQYEHLTLGESIAVHGVCLTVIDFDTELFFVDVSPETLNQTMFGALDCGQSVNLERAMTLNDRLGGHLVSGHVDQTAHVTVSEVQAPFLMLEVGLFDASVARYLTPKGSIAVNGVSLTINKIHMHDSHATVALTLVPHTQSATTLGLLVVSDQVNVEFDMIAKMVARQSAIYEM